MKTFFSYLALALALTLNKAAPAEGAAPPVDQSTPEKTMGAIFAAAKAGDLALASALMPTGNSIESELGTIRKLPTEAPGVQEKFRQFFGNGEIKGAAQVSEGFANLTILIGPDGAKEEMTMRFKQEGEKWVPLALLGTGFFDDAYKDTPALPDAPAGPVAVDQSTPEKVLETLFAAAAADDYEAAKALVPEKGLPSSDIRKIGSLKDQEDGVRGKFKEWFQWGKVAGPAKVEAESARVQIRFGDGAKETESMQVKLVDGKWYLHRLLSISFFKDAEDYAAMAPEIKPPPAIPAGEVSVDQTTPMKTMETLLAAAKAKNYAVVEALVEEGAKGNTLSKMAALCAATDEEKASFHAWFDGAEIVGEPTGTRTATVKIKGGEDTAAKTMWLRRAEDGRYFLYSFIARVF